MYNYYLFAFIDGTVCFKQFRSHSRFTLLRIADLTDCLVIISSI